MLRKMNQRMKKLSRTAVTLVIAASMLSTNLAVFPAKVFALDIVGEGTAESPYIITTQDQLQAIQTGEYPNADTAHYELDSDIMLTVGSTRNWTPITNFSGVFDGKMHSISNMNIYVYYTYCGFIRDNYGTIKNLKIIGLSCLYSSIGYAIGPVAAVNYGTIENCYAYLTPYDTLRYVGGLVGLNGVGGTIRGCYTEGSFNSQSSNLVGGLAGRNDGTIEDCYSTVSGTGFGSLVGINGAADSEHPGQILRCYAAPDQASSFIYQSAAGSVTQDCYFNQGGQSDAYTVLSPSEMRLAESFTNWDFTGVWEINSDRNNGYPFLRAFEDRFKKTQQQLIVDNSSYRTSIQDGAFDITVSGGSTNGALSYSPSSDLISVSISGNRVTVKPLKAGTVTINVIMAGNWEYNDVYSAPIKIEIVDPGIADLDMVSARIVESPSKDTYDGRDTMTVSFEAKAKESGMMLNGLQQIALAYDNSLLQLVSWDASFDYEFDETPGGPLLQEPGASGPHDFGSVDIAYTVNTARTVGYAGFQISYFSDFALSNTAYVPLGSFRLALRQGKTYADFTPDSIRMVTTAEMHDITGKDPYSSVIMCTKDNMQGYVYGAYSNGVPTPGVDTIAIPAFVRDGFPSADYTVSGIVKSYNPKNETAIFLMKNGAEAYKTVIIAADGTGTAEQSFSIKGVAPGTYSLVIKKAAHTAFTVNNIKVDTKDVDLRQDSRASVKLMTLLCGDLNNDNYINVNDLNIVWSSQNYGKDVKDAQNPLCDLNGDGAINVNDLNILWSSLNYGKGAVIIN